MSAMIKKSTAYVFIVHFLYSRSKRKIIISKNLKKHWANEHFFRSSWVKRSDHVYGAAVPENAVKSSSATSQTEKFFFSFPLASLTALWVLFYIEARRLLELFVCRAMCHGSKKKIERNNYSDSITLLYNNVACKIVESFIFFLLLYQPSFMDTTDHLFG